MKIGTKLYLGFAVVGLILISVVVITMIEVKKNQNLTQRVIELRAPTALAGTEMLNGINHSLAALRGWMILGKDQFKSERTIVWKEIEDAMGKMDEFSKNWTVQANKDRLNEIKGVLEEFKVEQQEIEDIAQTTENTPATVILIGQAAPQAAIMATEITNMIDLEGSENATIERKQLLGMMADVRGTLGLGLANIRAYLLTGDSTFKDGFDTLWVKNTRRFGDLTNNREILTTEQAKSYEKFAEARTVFDPLPPQMFEIRSSAEWNLANAWLGTKAAPKAAQIVSSLNEMKVNQQNLLTTDSELADEAISELIMLQRILLVIGLVLASVIAWYVSKLITVPLNRMLAMLKDIAEGEGDLTKKLDVSGKDEVGNVASWFNVFVGKIRDLVGEISQSSEQVASSSEELSASAQSLASSATEQAASLEETSASLEELITSVEQNTQNAQSANEIAQKAAQDAESGGKAVSETVEAMKQIADQIAIVDDIADQTNLLALNAAIEAARAGEMGKGFAVVAVEVRKLAERSQQAAKEISGLAKNSVTGAEKSGELIEQIVPDIQKTAQLVQGITNTCQEQSNTADQIRQAVGTLDQVTQQNSATSEETAASSEELSSQAITLQEIVSRFKFHDGAPTQGRPISSLEPHHAHAQVPRLPEPDAIDNDKHKGDQEFHEF